MLSNFINIFSSQGFCSQLKFFYSFIQKLLYIFIGDIKRTKISISDLMNWSLCFWLLIERYTSINSWGSISVKLETAFNSRMINIKVGCSLFKDGLVADSLELLPLISAHVHYILIANSHIFNCVHSSIVACHRCSHLLLGISGPRLRTGLRPQLIQHLIFVLLLINPHWFVQPHHASYLGDVEFLNCSRVPVII